MWRVNLVTYNQKPKSNEFLTPLELIKIYVTKKIATFTVIIHKILHLYSLQIYNNTNAWLSFAKKVKLGLVF